QPGKKSVQAARRRCRGHGDVPKGRGDVSSSRPPQPVSQPAGMGHVMAAPDRDRRPPMAVAGELASQGISVALMMALPALLGYWADQKVGSSPWLVVTGALVGLAAGMTQLVRGFGGSKKRAGNESRGGDEKSQ